jgi:hypothetical protein
MFNEKKPDRSAIGSTGSSVISGTDATPIRCQTPPKPAPIQADRFNAGKPKLSYISSAPAALIGLSNVFTFGAEVKGYGRDNWKKGLPITQLIDSLDRHKLAFFNGQDTDDESGLPHVDHILWNALVLSEMFHSQPHMDDRKVGVTL